MFELRPYQTRTVEQVHELETFGTKGVCIQAPTGSGKTVMLAKLLMDDKPQLLVTHRRILLDQLSAELTAAGISHGFRAAGRPRDKNARVQLAMIQTEHARLFAKGQRWELHPCERVLIDEAHDIKGKTAQKVVAAYQKAGATLVGCTATPTELEHLFDKVVVSATVPELIKGGFLVPPRIYTPDGPGLDRLDSVPKQSNGEFVPSALAKVWNPKVILGRVIDHYHRLNPWGKPAVLFAPGVPDSLWYAQKLTAAGIRAAHLDGERIWLDGEFQPSESDARQHLFGLLRSGELKVICNRFVLREGFNLPEIEHIILACIFGTRVSYVQSCGRGLRPSEGKDHCIIQDHGGNAWRFEYLAGDDPWDITTSAHEQSATRIDRLRDQDLPEPIICPCCDTLRISGPECPECGYRHSLRSRRVLELDGTLRLDNGPLYRPRVPRPRMGDAKVWESIYYRSLKHYPKRTFRQAYVMYAKMNEWRWLSRELPLMPMDPADWGKRIPCVPKERLYAEF